MESARSCGVTIDLDVRSDKQLTNALFHLSPDNGKPSSRMQEIKIGNTTSAQNIFCRFTSLLDQTPVKNRPVLWWASRVNVSAKYLSAICREVEGKSARALIAESIIQEATRLLQNPNLTIKEISDRLGFVNQSHFGTFFKRHTGHSPINNMNNIPLL